MELQGSSSTPPSFATFVFLRYGDDPLFALTEAVGAGGDTDSIGAIVGGWLGASRGAQANARGSFWTGFTMVPSALPISEPLESALSLVREGEPCPCSCILQG